MQAGQMEVDLTEACSMKDAGTGRKPLTVKCKAAGGLEMEKERSLELRSVLLDQQRF